MCKDSNDTVAREPYLSTLARTAADREVGEGGGPPDEQGGPRMSGAFAP